MPLLNGDGTRPAGLGLRVMRRHSIILTALCGAVGRRLRFVQGPGMEVFQAAVSLMVTAQWAGQRRPLCLPQATPATGLITVWDQGVMDEKGDGMRELTLDGRVRRLERQNRMLKLGVVAALAATVASVLWVMVVVAPGKQTTPGAAGVIEGQKFIARDANGTVRAGFGLHRDEPALALYDANGKLRVALNATGKGPALSLCDTNGDQRVWVGLMNDQPAVTLLAPTGDVRAFLGMVKDDASFTMYDSKRNLVYRAPQPTRTK